MSLSYQVPTRIDTEEDEEENRKAPQRRASVTEERQRDSDDRRQAQYHSHIYEYVEQEDSRHTIAVHSPELERLSFRHIHQP